jgi:hypothetical protein
MKSFIIGTTSQNYYDVQFVNVAVGGICRMRGRDDSNKNNYFCNLKENITVETDREYY